MIEHELDATRPYTYSDYDGESLTLRQAKGSSGPFATAEYQGAGPVFFGGTDAVLRTALALIVRGADEGLPYVSTVVHGLRAAIEDIEDDRIYKRGQMVEVYTDWAKDWLKGEVMGYYDDGDYAILPEKCGVYISYSPENIRELQEEN